MTRRMTRRRVRRVRSAAPTRRRPQTPRPQTPRPRRRRRSRRRRRIERGLQQSPTAPTQEPARALLFPWGWHLFDFGLQQARAGGVASVLA
eukprot:1600304-Pyramimonas_sp.AAC.1